MNQVLRIARNGMSEQVWSKWNSSSYGQVRLIQITGSDPKQPSTSKLGGLDKSKPSNSEMNVMEETFGEGYSTRSDEEGFGGIYTENSESTAKANIIHDPAHHDNEQGSEVKEKEKGRNTTETE